MRECNFPIFPFPFIGDFLDPHILRNRIGKIDEVPAAFALGKPALLETILPYALQSTLGVYDASFGFIVDLFLQPCAHGQTWYDISVVQDAAGVDPGGAIVDGLEVVGEDGLLVSEISDQRQQVLDAVERELELAHRQLNLPGEVPRCDEICDRGEVPDVVCSEVGDDRHPFGEMDGLAGIKDVIDLSFGVHPGHVEYVVHRDSDDVQHRRHLRRQGISVTDVEQELSVGQQVDLHLRPQPDDDVSEELVVQAARLPAGEGDRLRRILYMYVFFRKLKYN